MSYLCDIWSYAAKIMTSKYEKLSDLVHNLVMIYKVVLFYVSIVKCQFLIMLFLM